MVTMVLTEEQAEFLYDLLNIQAESQRIDDPAYSEMCDQIAEQLEPGGA